MNQRVSCGETTCTACRQTVKVDWQMEGRLSVSILQTFLEPGFGGAVCNQFEAEVLRKQVSLLQAVMRQT